VQQLKEEGGFQFIDEGKGQTMLLLHGLFGALSNWVDVVEKFSSKYNVVIPMLPIYNLPLLNTNVKALADFVNSFIEYKKIFRTLQKSTFLKQLNSTKTFSVFSKKK